MRTPINTSGLIRSLLIIAIFLLVRFQVAPVQFLFIMLPLAVIDLSLIQRVRVREALQNLNKSQFITVAFLALALQSISIFLLTPLITNLTGESIDLSAWDPLKESLTGLLIFIIIGWIVGGFLEEFVYRRYILNSFISSYNANSMIWKIAAVGITSLIFALAHSYQNAPGVANSFVSSLIFSSIYLHYRKKTLLAVWAHGLYDMLGILAIYIGLV